MMHVKVYFFCIFSVSVNESKILSLTLFSRAQSFALTSDELVEDAYTTAEVSGSLKISQPTVTATGMVLYHNFERT